MDGTTRQEATRWRTAGGGRRAVAVGTGAVVVLALAGACAAADPPATEAALRTLAATVAPFSSSLAPGSGPSAGTDGDIPDGTTLTPFDTGAPAVGNLDGPLLEAVQQAARDARAQGIEMTVTSGWRSKEYQQRLLDKGVARYGSLERARQFVNTPEKSAHVSGKAIDIGPTNADYWLIQHGARYGLCQVYANEIWHFELLTSPGGTCPAQLPDAAG
ncbi:M15 family metallopeptidase [Kitasatospora sp. NPDC059811]|uniref:M15 family metallopeptidase n=1 Tax=Streptomycetaceae TaxID=2062 RepID=UPI00099F7275|nr:M15 family metallopeptidase [Streptomyces sp. MJM8645]